MGMYDTFWGSYKCPACDKTVHFEEQTYDYNCVLEDFVLGDYIDRGNRNYYYKFESYCPYCHEKHTIALVIRRGQFVGIFQDYEVDEINIEDFENIEDGYLRNRIYERMCSMMIGKELTPLEGTNEPEVLRPGEEIEALGTTWIVDESYIVRTKVEVHKALWGEERVYKVHSGDTKRILSMQKKRPIHIYEDVDVASLKYSKERYSEWQNYCQTLIEKYGFEAIIGKYFISHSERLEKIY